MTVFDRFDRVLTGFDRGTAKGLAGGPALGPRRGSIRRAAGEARRPGHGAGGPRFVGRRPKRFCPAARHSDRRPSIFGRNRRAGEVRQLGQIYITGGQVKFANWVKAPVNLKNPTAFGLGGTPTKVL